MTYVRVFCDIRPYTLETHVRFTGGGNLAPFLGDNAALVVPIEMVKIRWNSDTLADGVRYYEIDLKYFFLQLSLQ